MYDACENIKTNNIFSKCILNKMFFIYVFKKMLKNSLALEKYPPINLWQRARIGGYWKEWAITLLPIVLAKKNKIHKSTIISAWWEV
jgi:hypothetical protein